MIDFIEYVVAELKSKRLSKTDAAALVRQFSARPSIPAPASRIHPLLHRNTSDLSEQRYCSRFTGEEFFLADHQVKVNGRESQRVLPGVAYLEMARAAIEHAWPAPPQKTMLELRNTVWAQPIVVRGSTDVSIALMANDEDEIDYEVYSQDEDQEIVHCQGRALRSRQAAPDRLDLEQVETRMGQGVLAPERLYAACARMGLVYGPAFQGVTAIHRGDGQVLAQLRLPTVVADRASDFVLHPSVMDGALQAAVGLIDGGPELSVRPRLPFALDSLRVVSPCRSQMVAWVRYAPGSHTQDQVVKLDIDLCDEQGTVCVQLHGLSWRVLGSEMSAGDTPRQPIGSLLAVPVWHASDHETSAGDSALEYTDHHVILCEPSHVNANTLAASLPRGQCVALQSDGAHHIAQRYSEYALACFERIQAILQGKPQGTVLVQVVVFDHQEQAVLAGLAGLLKTAALENPQLTGQLLLVAPDMTSEKLAQCLEEERSHGLDSLIRYEQGSRRVLRWQEVLAERDTPEIPFKDDGVYLITGGLGALGVLFVKEILEQTRRSRVVLTGRSAFTTEKQARVDRLSSQAGRVCYRQVDIGNLDQVTHLIAATEEEYGRLTGILHCAGIIADNYILKKTGVEFSQVLAPKVTGTFNLDQASRGADLDFFVLFSSLSGAMGNPGQADYAAANGFLDQFAAYRNGLVAARQRHGRTCAINWGLWQAGGMAVDAATQEVLQHTTGMRPMQTATGLAAFYRSLALPCDRMLAVEGDLAQIRCVVLDGPAAPGKSPAKTPAVAGEIDTGSLAEKTQDYLRKQFSELLKLPSHQIDPQAALEQYGIDSILAMKLTNQLEKTFGSLSKTLFFEYQTIRELAEYFSAHYAEPLTALLAPAANRPSEAAPPAAQPAQSAVPTRVSNRRFSRSRSQATSAPMDAEPIAIVGLSGRYPEAVDIDAYWHNLREGKDCIIEVPRERWDWREYFSDDRSRIGHHFSKWGGFMTGVDEFDPLFFNISPVDAELIDPQERLFLQHAWMAIEDAGYTRATLQTPSAQDLPGQVGVYVGVMYSEYQLFGAEATARGQRLGIAGSFASIANRVSYAFNLHGPSMTLDTMCSSSLSAIHVACQDLKQGRTTLAIAGGVNVSIHPNKYLLLSAGQFISSDGHCQSFGEGGDGYIPGEGVGVVVLKRLSEAQRDGDHIYGIIRGSALNHGGKTNGYTVPNPQAQTTAIARALAESRIDPRHIGYIEAHGTGTRLGDPIEIAALSKAFRAHTPDTEFCRIGSVKSNIGHCESAAGIAGLTKVLLQMQHQQIVPSLHSAQLNPHIDFPKTPFVVNQSQTRWEPPVVDGRTLPRIAGISSFGAGGSNAHMIVEEYQPPVQPPTAATNVIILISARTTPQLQEKVRDLLAFVRPRVHTLDLVDMAYTLQVGREAMEERLGLVVSSVEQLADKLQAFVTGEPGIEGTYQGQVTRNRDVLSLFSGDTDLQHTVDKWIASKKLPKLLDLWVKGLELDWSKLYGEARPRRISLPTYPFAKERYWIDTVVVGSVAAKGDSAALLHPLLHRNTSDLSEQRYRSTFTGEEFFLADHQVKTNGGAGHKVMPGVAYLEMARAAIEHALPARPDSTVLELHNSVWAQPLVVDERTDVSIALSPNDREQIDYEIYSQNTNQDITHCQGCAVLRRQPAPPTLDLGQLKVQMGDEVEPSSVYATCARMGLVYGPTFQAITAIHRGSGQLLAQLRLPSLVADTSSNYVLHPSVMDGALQAAVGLADGGSESNHPRLPFALDTLRIFTPCRRDMVAWVRYAPGSQAAADLVKLDIDLCDEHGNVCVQMHGLSSRAAAASEIATAVAQGRAIGSLLATPVWQATDAAASSEASHVDYTQHLVILCGLSTVSAETLGSLVPDSQCLSVEADQQQSIAQRYSDCALACFERIQTILQSKPHGKVLVQVLVGDEQEQALLAGLSGLLKTAALENPQFIGQLILVPAHTTAEDLGPRLHGDAHRILDTQIRYEHGARQVLRWHEVPTGPEQPPIVFKDRGVYLITGGLGALGVLFTKEILEQTREAKVVVTGRSALTAEHHARLEGLSTRADRVSYRQVDLGDPEQVKRLIAAINDEHGRLTGILHCAGMIADAFILKKASADFRDVLAPKVTGTVNLDQASADLDLDFFALFSSIAGAMGNVGQADYATANGFLDQFAAYRNRLVAGNQRHGRTRSINWPLWDAGGMRLDPATQELWQHTTGMQPMQTATGMQAFYRSLSLPCDQMLVVEGDLTRMRHALLAGPAASSEPRATQPVSAAEIDTENLAQETQDYLRKQLSALLKLPSHRIDPHAALEDYGIDSILAMRLTNQLEKTFGSLSKTLFFEYQTIAALAGYFVKAYPAIVRAEIGLGEATAKDADRVTIENRPAAPARRSKQRFALSNTNQRTDIAIIGLAGRYPHADTLQDFWRNLQNGRDCITEIPPERWDHTQYYDPDPNTPGKSYSKWGGFIADVDKFDPLFFNISPKEAALIDPQERLFLETAWHTIEDAGYTKESISGRRIGVFVGVMWGHYELFGAQSLSGGDTAIPSSSHASIANRVSYVFDFQGPSLAVDTMCSSSLTAIHLACEGILRGDIDAAIAGGVNVTIHPYKYLSLSQGRFAASDGKCRSFGAGGDGYVPGEGVGAVLLKPLADALRDNDQIYAVIKSSTVNHGGKTNGYTVPNPNAQADLIVDALEKASIDPHSLSYVETHGTGTSLGDPIEITGLLKAFGGSSDAKQFCPIGSVKSNIGHLESAAGIAAVTKVLLQLKHKQLVPSLHADPPNPHINLEDSPFYVQTQLADWTRPAAHPRRAGVSSFGAGGANAHLILEDYSDAPQPDLTPRPARPEIFALSAKNEESLRRYAGTVVKYLETASGVSLASVAYTSQTGRTPMAVRLAIIATSLDELRDKLAQWSHLRSQSVDVATDAHELEDVFHGHTQKAQYSASSLIEGQAGKAFLQQLTANRESAKIARLWILGAEIDWSLLHGPATPKRVSLPTYPFARERCWIDQLKPCPRALQKSAAPQQVAASEVAEEKRRTYYQPQWTMTPLVAAGGRRLAIGPILVLDTSDALASTIRQHLANHASEDAVVVVKPGKTYQEIAPSVYAINHRREEQFDELVETLGNRGLLPGLILHHGGDAANLDSKQHVAQQLNRGIHTLSHLCRALMKQKHQAPLKIMSVFSSQEEAGAPLEAAIAGFLKTLALENPRYHGKVVEIEGGPQNADTSLTEKAGLVWDEVYDGDWTTQEIRYRYRREGRHGYARYVRELVPYKPTEAATSALPLRQKGVYLITGGLGGLGLIFGEHLARNFESRLVLVGRSVLGSAQEEKIRRLEGYGAEVLYLQADVSRLQDMNMVVQEAKARFGEINGVIHASGVTRDAFILKKTREEMEDVLAPKVYGAINVDLATSGESLDWCVLFSSVAGIMGNVGQADYAYGNRFLDALADRREHLRRAQKRSGRTISIAWPLWEEGGMGVSRDAIARLEQRTGISPLPTQEGIRYWEDFLRSEAPNGVALYGTASRIDASIATKPAEVRAHVSAPALAVDPAALLAKTEAYVKALIGEEITLAPDRIGSADRFESFGIDSVMINRLNATLERDLGALPKTVFYEYETVAELARFLVQEARGGLIALFGVSGSADQSPTPQARVEEEDNQRNVSRPERHDALEPIAIIGIHGYYPHSENLEDYWDNLKHGRDLIDLVSPDRWNYEEFYHPDPAAAADGKIYCKWGAFLDGYDKFDAQFFNISADEARMIDPQERLFLESVWAAIEDAGYTRDTLKTRFPKARSADVGVFVGVTTNSYHLWALEERNRGHVVFPGALPWSIANRVSYFFDFNGPSMPVDTACSSSLVAVHLACESLKRGECQVAIAGGVNLYLHPSKYQSLCKGRMLSLNGKCRSYGAGDDGFVPGEGVGTLILKPLRKAIDDRDRIYAVIPASACDHSGRSNGYSAPNPNAQANVISRTLEKAHIHPETIGYVEGHGTGTQLGDSIEIAALTRAFRQETAKSAFCPIGSVKANIGHAESAAGMASLAKVILQLQHRQLAPSIHSDEANPNIEFAGSPFYLQHGLSDWPAPPTHPRRALVNAFGAGGVNACVVVEDYEPSTPHDPVAGPYVFTLSARNEDRLRDYVNRLLLRLRREPTLDLASLCYTLQAGREAMDERLAIVASDVHELVDRLEEWCRGGSPANTWRGNLSPRGGSHRPAKAARAAAGEHSPIELASMWAAGAEVDWASLYSSHTPRRIGLPTYPFARERYWVSDDPLAPVAETRSPSSGRLHPLVCHNSSTLKEVSFTSSLSDRAFYAVDHNVNDQSIFPGAGFLEVACISGNIACEERVRQIRDIVWIQPLSFRTGPQTLRTVLSSIGDSVEYVISSCDEDSEAIVHSEGRLAFRHGRAGAADAGDRVPIQALKAKCARRETGAMYYDEFRKYGINYGPSFQTIQEMYSTDAFALSRLKMADHLTAESGQFILHPTMIDGALQTAAGLVRGLDVATPCLPFALDELDIIQPVPQTCYAYAEYADEQTRNHAGVRKFNIRLLNESGDVLIIFKNLYVRPLATRPTGRHSLAAVELAAQ